MIDGSTETGGARDFNWGKGWDIGETSGCIAIEGR